jgi:hypothetical protein
VDYGCRAAAARLSTSSIETPAPRQRAGRSKKSCSPCILPWRNGTTLTNAHVKRLGGLDAQPGSVHRPVHGAPGDEHVLAIGFADGGGRQVGKRPEEGFIGAADGLPPGGTGAEGDVFEEQSSSKVATTVSRSRASSTSRC